MDFNRRHAPLGYPTFPNPVYDTRGYEFSGYHDAHRNNYPPPPFPRPTNPPVQSAPIIVNNPNQDTRPGHYLPYLRTDIPPPPMGRPLTTPPPQHFCNNFFGAEPAAHNSTFEGNLHSFVGSHPPVVHSPSGGVSLPGPSAGPAGGSAAPDPGLSYDQLMAKYKLLHTTHSKTVAELADLKSGDLGGHLESGGGHNPVDSEDNEDDQEERNVDADSNETGQAILMFIYLIIFNVILEILQ